MLLDGLRLKSIVSYKFYSIAFISCNYPAAFLIVPPWLLLSAYSSPSRFLSFIKTKAADDHVSLVHSCRRKGLEGHIVVNLAGGNTDHSLWNTCYSHSKTQDSNAKLRFTPSSGAYLMEE